MSLILRMIKKHSSLLLIVFGAGCFFLSNIIFKQKLNNQEFGIYSLIITYFSLIYIYGLLGYEQVFLRYSNLKKKNIIFTQKISINIILFTSVITSVICSILFCTFYLEHNINVLLVVLASFSLVCCMTMFSLFRLNEDFTIAQLIANFWKISLIIICSLYLFQDKISVGFITEFLSLIIITFTIIFGFYTLKNIRFEFNNTVSQNTILQSFFYFFISISTFSIITFGDRFIIENKINLETLGTYFYLSNFLLAPFNILQNYIGFKQLTEYKKQLESKLLIKYSLRAIILGIGLGCLLLLITYIIDHLNVLNFKFNMYYPEILLLITLGIVKLYASVITPAFEVTTNIKMLKTFNLLFITSTFILFISLLISSQITMVEVIIALAILWLIRTLLQHYLIMKNKFVNLT